VMHFISAMRQVSPESDSDLPEVAKRVRQVFASDLEPHFVEEERYALPLLRESGHEALAEEIFSQHQKMRAMDQALDHPTTTLLVEFVHMLEKHVELEENEVWDLLDAAIAQQQGPAASNA